MLKTISRLTRYASVAALILIGGCAAISEEECHTADWYQRGLADGNSGLTASQLDSYMKICNKAGAPVNANAYLQGRNEGLRLYCTADRGREEGLMGRSYRRVCPAHLEPAFLRSYTAANEVYQAEQEIDRIHSQIQSKEDELEQIRDPSKRRHLRNEIRDLDRQSTVARNRLQYAERELRAYERR